ncbi:MAG: sigma 54-interacting transcriptional regulator [Planctomycetes bacterium]|nr:sigma 54-interacting transcriptional regulator [Planctomycetota bacterium]
MPEDFPFLSTALENECVTICALSDSRMRLRDPWAVYHLVRFLSARGVHVEIVTMLAGFHRYLDSHDLLQDLPPGSKPRRLAESTLRDPVLTFDQIIEKLFIIAEEGRRQRIEALRDGQKLPPFDPLIVLGRPRLYPAWFFDALDAELRGGRSRTGIHERFRLEVDDPIAWDVSPSPDDRSKYRNMIDTYSQIVLREVPFPDSGTEEGTFVDYGILRLVEGSIPSRTALFIFGASALGTIGAAQAVVDPEQAEIFKRLEVRGCFRKYGAVEALIRVERQSRALTPWPGSFVRGEIEVIGPPVPPVSEKAGAWISLFRSAQQGATLRDLYTCAEVTTNARRFAVIGVHPQVEPEKADREREDEDGEEPERDEGKKKIPHPRVHHFVGGTEMGKVFRRIRLLVAGKARLILIEGERGVGKDLAARIAYQEAVIELFQRLPEMRGAHPPLIPGPRFVEFRCADAAGGRAVADLSGVVETLSRGVPNFGALFQAGEGVVHLIGVEVLPLDAQAVIRNVVEPPHLNAPVGASTSSPVSALIVASTSDDLKEVVGLRRMLADLQCHLAANAVRIPPLRERPGDIPALLASIAGEPVRFNDRVLRCLLAARHETNELGLTEIIGRAKTRRGVRAGSILSIEEADLEPGMARMFEELYEERKKRGRVSPDTVFEFSAPPRTIAAAPLFAEAADVLGALACHDRKFLVRPCAKEGMGYWPSRKPQTCETLTQRWIHLVGHAVGMRDGATGLDPLELLRRMSHLRWSHNPVRKPITVEFVKAYLRCGEDWGILQKDVAKSLQVSRAMFARLAVEERAKLTREP